MVMDSLVNLEEEVKILVEACSLTLILEVFQLVVVLLVVLAEVMLQALEEINSLHILLGHHM